MIKAHWKINCSVIDWQSVEKRLSLCEPVVVKAGRG
jgi:hypothetical protein